MAENNNGATLGFEEKLWQAADKMRNNMDAAEYKHVVLGLLFLKPKLQLQVEHFGKMAATSGCIKVVEKCIE